MPDESVTPATTSATTEPVTPADDHEAEPPQWATDLINENKRLAGEVTQLKNKAAQPPQQQQQPNRDSNGNTTDGKNVQLPGTVVQPKPPSILSKFPKWF